MCLSICAHWALFFESMYSHVYGVKGSLREVFLGSLNTFFKFPFWQFYGHIWVKIRSFSLNHGEFDCDMVQNKFETQTGCNMSTFRGMPSLLPKFAFLVPEIGAVNFPNLRSISEIRLLHKVMGHFLVGFRGVWRCNA